MGWLAALQAKMDAVTSTQRADWKTQRGKAGQRQATGRQYWEEIKIRVKYEQEKKGNSKQQGEREREREREEYRLI
jgi:hypothetical protein